MSVRMAEVAERAGVSVSTVSRVLNGKPGVNPVTRDAVLTALDVLGYDRPRRLGRRESGLVGLLIPELTNPFFSKLAQLVEHDLVGRGYTPMLATRTLGSLHEDDYVRTMLEHGVSGLAFVSGIHAIAGADPARYVALTDRGLPIVLVNGFLPGVPAAFVSNDDARSVELAVAHLANMGHRRIGLALGQHRYQTVQRKRAAFGEAMRRHVDGTLSDDALGPWISHTWFTVEGGTTAAHDLLDRQVTAIVAGSDLMALGAISAARARGLDVPGRVSVVGMDDSALMAYTDPPLTTVRQPAEQMAAALVSALDDLVQGGGPPPAEVLLPPELVVRGSAARAPE